MLEALVLMLVIPLLGALIAGADALRRNGETPGARAWGRRLLGAAGALLVIVGCSILVSVVETLLPSMDDSPWVVRFFTFLVRMIVGGVVLFAGWRSLWLARGTPEAASIAEHIRQEQRMAQFHLAKWALLLAPFLLLGLLGVMLVLPLLYLSVFVYSFLRTRDGQFLWVLTLATESGLPLVPEVEAFAQTQWRSARRKFEILAGLLRDGHSLSDALELAPRVLPRPTIMELRVAEETGTLTQVLRQCALRQTAALAAQQSQGSLLPFSAYAWGMLLIIPLIVSFLMYWIVPKIKYIFNDFGIELPTLTTGLIRTSDVIFDHFGLLSVVVTIPILAALAATVVYIVGWGNLNLPLLMRWFPRRDAPSLMRSLALTVKSGFPLPAMLSELAEHHPRRDLSARYRRMSQALEAGEPTWQVLRQEGFVRPEEAAALEAAARNDNLPWVLTMLADGIDGHWRRRGSFWAELLKPLIVIGIGVVVGLFVISMFLPLVKLINELA